MDDSLSLADDALSLADDSLSPADKDRRSSIQSIAQCDLRTLLTHRSNFHNYTVGKPFNDRTVKRYMIRLEVKDPVVYSEIEWICVQIQGQSFMLHQIVSGGNGGCMVLLGRVGRFQGDPRFERLLGDW
jgi:hypothetical protein